MVKAASNPHLNDDDLGPMIHDIQHMLANAMDWKVSFTPKNANQADHVLAKLACSITNDVIWMGEFPNIILEKTNIVLVYLMNETQYFHSIKKKSSCYNWLNSGGYQINLNCR